MSCYISEYFLCKGAEASGEEVRIFRARVGSTRTLGFPVMERKVNAFFNNSHFPHGNGPNTSQSKEGLCVKRNEAKIFVADEKQLKEILDS